MLLTAFVYLIAYPQYRSLVPNGYANGQATGHAGGSPFRWAFKDAGYAWTEALCNEDTDGDGQSNGVELGDPCCAWVPGATPAFTSDISIPGDSTSLTSRSIPSCATPSPPMSPSVPSPSVPMPSPPMSPSVPMPSPPPPQSPMPSAPPSSTCGETHDYILVGSGAGGSPAAAFLRARGASFAWFEAGVDESQRLTTYPSVNPESYPRSMWQPTLLQTTTGRQFPYQIPLGTGGQTSHYVGVNYWTLRDTQTSLQMLPHEMVALDFVVNRTLERNVYCDAFDERFHTHARQPRDPAPDTPAESAISLPMCLYGRCVNASSCRLNDYMAATLGLVDAEAHWYRWSSFLEYGGSGVRIRHSVVHLIANGTTVTGVRVRGPSGAEFVSCASRAVLLAAGVMGNARILSTPLSFFAQPVVVYVDLPVASRQVECDAGTMSGGTIHHARFLSTFAACAVNGTKRLVYATPQAINPIVNGNVTQVDGGDFVATVNYDDPRVYETLWSDLAEAAQTLFGVDALPLPADARVQYASYHWTGTEELVHRSRHRAYTNLFVADAMAVVGTTTGWTSFNARVAGAVAALRALDDDDACHATRHLYEEHCCDGEAFEDTCMSIRRRYQERSCCLA